MSVILSLQGCMAAGKTTVARYVENNMKDVFVSYENPIPVLEEVKRQGWIQNTLEGFVEIQRLFIQAEINRWEACGEHNVVLMDLGADEIEFYILFYPKSMGYEWKMEELLAKELDALRECTYTGVLFLSASPEVLQYHKKMDTTRRRGHFEHYLTNMYQAKIEWFASRKQPKTDFLNVDEMTIEQAGQQAVRWIKGYM
jgi:hypothetical protein